MKKNEQDILNIIEEKTKDIVVPEALSPEKIEEQLKKTELERKRKQRRRRKYLGGLAAACVVLAAGIFTFSYMSERNVTESAGAAAETEQNRTANGTEKIPTAESYEEIYSYMEEMYEEQASDEGFSVYDLFGFMGSGSDEMAVEEYATESSADAMTMSSGMARSEGSDYSTTNVRQDGVDEADIVKTDGKYLYVLKDNGQEISIVDTKNGLAEVQAIELSDEYYIQEFYMLPAEEKVILICSYYGADATTEDGESNVYYGIGANKTCVITYSVKDVKNPVQEGMVWQSGSYTSSRLADGYVYLFSNYYAMNNLAKENPETYIPLVDEKMIDAGDIYLPSLTKGCMYEIVTSIEVAQPDKAADSKAIFTEGGEIYVSNENIYYYETQWNNSYDAATTTIRKISYSNGALKAEAQSEIDGYLEDSFSIDEYDGYLRIVATVDDTNSVYVLDEDLEMTGKIEGLAEDERVYSARFMGDTGYFVTFRETDPLFTVDLSNPKAPKIIGKLKIPGFSEYLHFYGEDKLLGIGMDADEETGITEGVKLTMFDISDKTDVKEEATYIMENVYSTDVEYDYKAALIDVGKNIIGFAGYPEGRQKYYLFSYDEEKGFTCNMEEEINGNASRSARGLYISDTLYVVQGNVIESYSLITYQKEDDLIL